MDTIFALSTAPSRSGVAVIRISGDCAEDLLHKVFRSKHSPKNRAMTLGTLVDTHGDVIDHCLAVLFRGGASYTGEPSAELHTHGSPAVISAALDALAAAGGRPAAAGEFTRRAFLNGKLDLAEAEAVGELIAAETAEAARNAAAMMDGALGRLLRPAYDELIDVCANLAAEVDYPDDDVSPLTSTRAAEVLDRVQSLLYDMLSRSDRARAYTEGVRTAIVGAPNAGKSTLFNAILGERRAIVTNLPGTTRDLLRERASLGGVPLILTDTAGLREAEGEVERIGVQLARDEVQSADLALLVVDGSTPPTDDDLRAAEAAFHARNVLVLLNKSDLGAVDYSDFAPQHIHITISAASDDLSALASAVSSMYDAGDLRFDGTILSNARQRAACHSALERVNAALQALADGLPTDLALTDAELAAQRLGELFGHAAAEDVIDRVFANFCVGK